MTAQIVYQGDLRTEAIHIMSGNSIITDAPIDNEGKGETFSPTDLVATAHASCMLTIMGIAAQKRSIEIEGTKVEMTKIMASNPRRIAEIQIQIIFPNDQYSDQQRKILENAAITCPVSKSLHPDLLQNINFIYPNRK